MMRQIILVTDGCSNEGMSPVVAAAHALAEGIVVNVIGVMDNGELGQKGMVEISDIAKAGGGISRIVRSQLLIADHADGDSKNSFAYHSSGSE